MLEVFQYFESDYETKVHHHDNVKNGMERVNRGDENETGEKKNHPKIQSYQTQVHYYILSV